MAASSGWGLQTLKVLPSRAPDVVVFVLRAWFIPTLGWGERRSPCRLGCPSPSKQHKPWAATPLQLWMRRWTGCVTRRLVGVPNGPTERSLERAVAGRRRLRCHRERREEHERNGGFQDPTRVRNLLFSACTAGTLAAQTVSRPAFTSVAKRYCRSSRVTHA